MNCRRLNVARLSVARLSVTNPYFVWRRAEKIIVGLIVSVSMTAVITS